MKKKKKKKKKRERERRQARGWAAESSDPPKSVLLVVSDATSLLSSLFSLFPLSLSLSLAGRPEGKGSKGKKRAANEEQQKNTLRDRADEASSIQPWCPSESRRRRRRRRRRHCFVLFFGEVCWCLWFFSHLLSLLLQCAERRPKWQEAG